MKRRISPLALGLLLIFLLAQGFLQRAFIYPKWSKSYNTGGSKISAAADPMQMVFALAGFREMVAGILWVRADSFFDSGNYDAILPIIRLVTLLDPKQIDVYATGMWHIGYNFTDEEQRSDRRYIPSALALGKEGAKNNPDTYELFFETGWMWYHKIDDDYQNAVKWFEQAKQRPDMLPARKNLLSMAYQRNGEIEKALENYFALYDAADKLYRDDNVYGNRQNRDTIENNIDTMLVRMVQRGYVAGKQGRPLDRYDVNPPFDVNFSAKVTVIEPMVLSVEGTWDVLPVGTRVRMVLRDMDFPNVRPAGMNWDYADSVHLDPEKDKTYMMDQLFVKNRRFKRKIDMSKDPTMYPFLGDKYLIEFYYNPRSAPPHIQDKFSWNGEGMTDKNFLNKEVRPGQRVVYASLVITRDQILRSGEWEDRAPGVSTANYAEKKVGNEVSDEILVDIPSLRAKK